VFDTDLLAGLPADDRRARPGAGAARRDDHGRR
jgi:hypothetical protein